jgi:hypothetical protein
MLGRLLGLKVQGLSVGVQGLGFVDCVFLPSLRGDPYDC